MMKLRVVLLAAAMIVLAAGALQINTEAAYGGNCPSGGSCGCSTAYAPVICKGNCRYTNMCHASCAGFTSSQCKDAIPN
jgi:hypothetical protein